MILPAQLQFSCAWKKLLAAGSSMEVKHKSLNHRAELLGDRAIDQIDPYCNGMGGTAMLNA